MADKPDVKSDMAGIEGHLAFIGKILSLYTHEQKNHLAIIGESAGLLGDIIEFSDTPPQPHQMLDIIKSIDAQIKRSSDMAKALNAFGHRMDSRLVSYNVKDCVSEVLALLGRLFSQKRITVVTDFSQSVANITGNPSNLQLLLFMAIIDTVEENSHITVRTLDTKDSVTIGITPKELKGRVDFTEDSDYFKPLHALTTNGEEINIIIPA